MTKDIIKCYIYQTHYNIYYHITYYGERIYGKNVVYYVFVDNKKTQPLSRLCLAPQVGLEPTATRLTAECSTIELLRIIFALIC